MASNEKLKFQDDMQRVELGYKMLADIEGKLNSYFKASTGNNQTEVQESHQKQVDSEVKDFSEFNFKPASRKLTMSENRSINVIDSAQLVERQPVSTMDYQGKTSRGFEQTDRTTGLISNLELKERSQLDDLEGITEFGGQKRQDMINNRISMLNNKIAKYQNENKELTEEFEKGEALARLSHNAESIKQRAMSTEAVKTSVQVPTVFENPHTVSNNLINENNKPSFGGSQQNFYTHSFNPQATETNGFFSNPVIADKIKSNENFQTIAEPQQEDSAFVQQTGKGLDKEKQIMVDLIAKQKEIISKMQETISLRETLQKPIPGFSTPTYRFRGSEVINQHNPNIYPLYPEFNSQYKSPQRDYYNHNINVPMSGITTGSHFYNPQAPYGSSNNLYNSQSNRSGNLFSKVRNPLFSSYYQKKAEWNQIKNGHLNDSNYAINDIRDQVYGPYEEQNNYYPGPTFRGPNEIVEDTGTQTTNKHSRMNTAQFGGINVPNTAPSCFESERKPALSTKSIRTRSRRKSKASRLSKMTKKSRKSKISRPNTSRDVVQFETNTNPVSVRSGYDRDESVYTELQQFNNRRGKRNFKKKKSKRRENIKSLRGFNSNIKSKIQNLSKLGDLVQGLTSLVESQIESKNVEPCQRLHAQKKRNRAVETIVRSLSNNHTSGRRRRINTSRFGELNTQKYGRSTIRTSRPGRVLCKEKSNFNKMKAAKKSRKSRMKNILNTLGQFGKIEI